MSQLNSFVIEGTVTVDPILSSTPLGKDVVAFDIIHKHRSINAKELSTFSIEAWEQLAETCASYLTKGRTVRVHGTVKQERWKDSHGFLQSAFKVVAKSIDFLSPTMEHENEV
jgi:single-strand DNA-binding protein